MTGISDILRYRGWRLLWSSVLVVLSSGCYRATPPSDEWLKENFHAHRADFDSIVSIVGSAATDDYVRYPLETTTMYDPDTGKDCIRVFYSDIDSIFAAKLGDGRRATLDSLLRNIGCLRLVSFSSGSMIELVCYTYGNMDGFTVQYVYRQDRPTDMVFHDDRDMHELWQEYMLDKENRHIPRKKLDDCWNMEYCP